MEEKTLEEKLRDLILSRYKAVTDFADECGIKYQTVMSILTRGVNKASINNIIKMCQTLGISTDELAKGQIVFNHKNNPDYMPIEKLTSSFNFMMNEGRVTLDDMLLSENEKDFLMDVIELNLELLRRKRVRDRIKGALND